MAKKVSRLLGKPKTAYGLLGLVCRAIASEPKRFNQSDWCGTAFCRAGWMVLLNDGAVPSNPETVGNRAEELLGMEGVEAWTLFSTMKLFDPGDARPGTRAYAAAGIRGTRRFMKAHETHLKSRLLKGV